MTSNPADLGGVAADFGTGPGGLSTAGDLGLSDRGDSADQEAYRDLQLIREVEHSRSFQGMVENFVKDAVDALVDFFTPDRPAGEPADLSGFGLDRNPELGGSIDRYYQREIAVPDVVEHRDTIVMEHYNQFGPGWMYELNRRLQDAPYYPEPMPNPGEEMGPWPIPHPIYPQGPRPEREAGLPPGTAIVPAGYTNPPPAGTVFRDGHGDPQVVLPTGRVVPVSAVENVVRMLRRGGSLNTNQRAVINALTPAQQRAAGIFLAPDGTVRPFREVLTAAVTNAAAGRPLTSNQQAALGLAFNSIPSSGARRDAINALASSARGPVRDQIASAVGQAMRAARDIARKARQQRAAQQAEARDAALRAVGVRNPRRSIAALEAAGIENAPAKLAALKAAGVTRPVSQVERLAAQGVRNPVQRLIAQAERRDKAAAKAAGTTVNKLRALRAAGVSRPAQKITRLKAAGVERPARKLAELRQAGVRRAAEKLVQLEAAGVQRPAQKIAALRQAGIKRGAQKVAQLKAAGVKHPVAKLTQLKKAGVKRPAQQLVQLKQAGVQRPAQKLVEQAAKRQPASSAKPAAQRGALGKTTQRIIRSTDQSLTFKTASGKPRSAAQVAANAARNRAAGRSLTPNQRRLLDSRR